MNIFNLGKNKINIRRKRDLMVIHSFCEREKQIEKKKKKKNKKKKK